MKQQDNSDSLARIVIYDDTAKIIKDYSKEHLVSYIRAANQLIALGHKYELQREEYVKIVEKIRLDNMVKEAEKRYSKKEVDFIERIVIEKLADYGFILPHQESSPTKKGKPVRLVKKEYNEGDSTPSDD